MADAQNFRVQVFTSKGKFLAKLGEKGSSPGQMNSPYAIAVNGSGSQLFLADTYNNRIQVFQKTPVESITKSIVIAGGGAFAGNNLWDATQLCANFAYRTLTYQGFSKESIYYSNNSALV